VVSFSESINGNISTDSVNLTKDIVHVIQGGFFTLKNQSKEVRKVVFWQWVVLNQNCSLFLESFEKKLVRCSLDFVGVL